MHRAPHRQHQPDITRGPPLPGRARPWPASPPPATGLGVGLGAASPTALGTGLLAHGSGHCSMPRHGMLGIVTAWGCARHGSALGAGVARDCPALGPAPARHTRSRASTGRGWWKVRLWAAGISTGITSMRQGPARPEDQDHRWHLPSQGQVLHFDQDWYTGPGTVSPGLSHWSLDHHQHLQHGAGHYNLGTKARGITSAWGWALHCSGTGSITSMGLALP